MEMNHVGLTELRQTGDVGASIGDIDLKEVTTGKEQSAIDDKTLPKEMPIDQWRSGQGDNGKRVAQFVTHQHLRLDAVVVERHHQAVGSDGSTSQTVTGINNKYPHKMDD